MTAEIPGSAVILRGPHVTLRPYRADDEVAVAENATSRSVWRNMHEAWPHPYTRADAREWIALATPRDGPLRHFAIERDGVFVGGAGAAPVEGDPETAEMGYWLGEPYWGRGTATEVAGLITDDAFSRFGYRRLQAGVHEWNAASARVLEKTSYVLETVHKQAILKDGQRIDSLVYVRHRAAWARGDVG